MFKNERHNSIMMILEERGFVTVRELSALLYMSESSIRRDLSDLEEKGAIKRRYGGAEIINSTTSVLPFKTRSYDNIPEKQEIAKKAAKLIKTGDIVFLDQSSTSFFLAREIMDTKSITVVTNNIEILNLLSDSEMAVISSGGQMNRTNRTCLVGARAEATFRSVYADLAFFSAKSLTEDGVISDCTEEEIHVREAMFENADTVVFLCNTSKCGGHSAYKQCTLADVDILVTEKETLPSIQGKYKNLKII